MKFNIKKFINEEEAVRPSTYLPKHKRYHDKEKANRTVQIVFKCSAEFKDFLYWYKKVHGFANLWQTFRWLFWQAGFKFTEPDEEQPWISIEELEEYNQRKREARKKREEKKNQSLTKDSDKD